MPHETSAKISEWLQCHSTQLASIAPEASLDDLEILRDIVGDARVVALGEGAHFIKEFWSVRQRLIRFLHEQLGFNIIAAEFDLREAEIIESWLANSDPRPLQEVSSYVVDWGMSGMVQWLRSWSATCTRRMRFLGLDVPNGGKAFATMFASVVHFLREVDQDSTSLLEEIEPIANALPGTSVVGSMQAWAALGKAKQDALTAGIARLCHRMRALKTVFIERSSHSQFCSALRQLEALSCSDYVLRATEAMHRGGELPLDLSVRDRFMADSLLDILKREPKARVVLLAHNGHVQKEPVVWNGYLNSALSLGFYLSNDLGDDYRVIGTSTTDNHTSEMDLNATSEVGFTVNDIPLERPEKGSLEAELVSAGLGDQITLTALRKSADAGISFDRIRAQSGYLVGNITAAYDGILVLPTVTVQSDLGF